MSPEIVNKKEYKGAGIDVWTAGILYYILLTGSFPF
jgi:serine/threonine protein kinase